MKHLLSIIGIIFVIILISLLYIFPFKSASYQITDISTTTPISTTTIPTLPPPLVVTHIKTPDAVKALYMSSWVGGNKKLRDNLVNIVDTTELNSIVIDIKDYTGRISFMAENPTLKEIGSSENRIPDVKEFIASLHDKGIYVIGRISTFQDSFYIHKKPEYAVKNNAGEVWKDYKGVSWLDVGAKPVWNYISLIGDEAYSVGFDELNFDYIRFPSDGNMKDISYPFSSPDKVKSETLNDFFTYIDKYFRPKGIPISADLFGMTTSNLDDLGIGQILENALAHFDYVAPMVYPSHYPKNFMGFENPASKPYEVIKYAMTKGADRAVAASTTPLKLRPWLQDFTIYKTTYTPAMVRAQIQATYDTGLTSWMLWNAANHYTASALQSSDNGTSTSFTQ